MRVVVTVPCTDRKRGGPPSPDAMLRTVAPGLPVAVRAERWVDRLLRECGSGTQLPLADLYVGPGWTASMQLLSAVSESIHRAATGYVVSAGLGLQPLSAEGTCWPRYSATFAGGHPDSVVGDRRGAGVPLTEWWAALGRSVPLRATTFQELAASHDAVIVVASAPYLRAVSKDLVAAAREGLQVVAFTASAARFGDLESYLVRFDARARSIVAASDARASADFVAFVARELGEGLINVDAVRGFVQRTLHGREAPRRPRGLTARPDEVRAFIEASLRADPGVRKGLLLRRWRDGGRAFEQRRFGVIYDGVADAARDGGSTTHNRSSGG